MLATFLTHNSHEQLARLDVDALPEKGWLVTIPTGRSSKLRKSYRVMDVAIDYQIVRVDPPIVLATAVVYVE